MSKPEWGQKRLCLNCSTRFYDMCRQPIACPKCATIFDPESLVKKRRGRPPISEVKSLPAELEESLNLNLTDDLEPLEPSDDVLEDTSDFGEDEVVGIETPMDED